MDQQAEDHARVQFDALLDHALQAADYVSDQSHQVSRRGVRGSDYPLVTLIALRVQADVHYRAAITLLRDGITSHAVETILRALTEYVAHAYFIWQPEYGGSERCRAICRELGVAQAAVQTMEALEKYPDALGEDVLTNARKNLETITEIHQREGCICKGQNWRDVQPLLLDMEQRGVAKPFIYWKASSVVAHTLAPFRIMTETDVGTVIGAPASFQQRAQWLGWVTSTFAITAKFILMIIKPDARPGLDGAVQSVYQDPMFVAAYEGRLDALGGAMEC